MTNILPAPDTVLMRLIYSAVSLAIAIVISLILDKIVKKRILKNDRYSSKNDTKDPIPFIILQVVKVVIFIAAIVEILNLWGFNVSRLLAGLGIASAVIGLALQDTIKDIFMGTHLYRDKYFTTGDFVEYNGKTAKVETFSLRTTRLRFIDRSTVSVSNRKLDEVKMASEFYAFEIPLSYQEDHIKVREVLTGIAQEIGDFPEVSLAQFRGVKKFDNSAIIYDILIKANPWDLIPVQFRGYNLIQDRLHEAGLQIPFPQIDVHVDALQDVPAQGK